MPKPAVRGIASQSAGATRQVIAQAGVTDYQALVDQQTQGLGTGAARIAVPLAEGRDGRERLAWLMLAGPDFLAQLRGQAEVGPGASSTRTGLRFSLSICFLSRYSSGSASFARPRGNIRVWQDPAFPLCLDHGEQA